MPSQGQEQRLLGVPSEEDMRAMEAPRQLPGGGYSCLSGVLPKDDSPSRNVARWKYQASLKGGGVYSYRQAFFFER